MNLHDKISTGLKAFDQVIDYLRYGDNVVWQVDSLPGYKEMVSYFIGAAENQNMRLVYIRFANHEPILGSRKDINIYHVDA